MKSVTLIFLLAAFRLCAQSDSLAAACRSRDSIRFGENLEPFFRQLLDDPASVKIMQIGDSHTQMGYFSGGIEAELKRSGDSLVNTAFWFPYSITGGFNPKGIKVETGGDWTGEKMVGSVTETRFSLTGHALVLAVTGSSTPFLNIQLPQATLEFEVLIETTKSWNFAGDAEKIRVKHIGDDLSIVSVRFNRPQKEFRLFACSQDAVPQPLRVFGFRSVTEQGGMQFESYGSSGGKYNDYATKCSYGLEQLAYSDPDLLIISLGTNDAFGDYTVQSYHAVVAGFIAQIREQNKHISILLTTQPDTFFKEQKPASDAVVLDVLTQIAREYNCALWDLAAVMGGNGSIQPWLVEGLAGADLLHFTPKGYAFQAQLLVEALNRLRK